MKKSIIISISLSALLLLAGCSSMINVTIPHTAYPKENYGKLYSPEELKKDLSFLFATIEKVHHDLFGCIDTLTLIKTLKKTADEFNTPINRLDFYKRIAPIVSMLNDGHTGVSLPIDEWGNYINTKGSALPLRMGYNENGGLFSMTDYYTVGLGDKIVSINGLLADSLLEVFSKNISAERPLLSKINAAGNFSIFLWLYGIEAPYNIVFKPAPQSPEESIEITNKMASEDSFNNLYKTNQNGYSPFSYKLLSEGIAYLNFSSMMNIGVSKFGDFLQTLFGELKEKKINGLIIDIRNNGGGQSFYGEMLLSYITDKPYRLVGGVDRKVSYQHTSFVQSIIPWYLRWITFKPFIYLAWPFFSEAKLFTANNGEIIRSEPSLTSPSTNPLLFKGKVCVLIGPRTFSGGVEVANAIEDYKLAVLVGEETGGVPNSFGDSFIFDLPNTQLSVRVSTARFIRANRDIKNKAGVLPDYIVRQSIDDLKKNKDTVLEFAKTLLENTSK